MGKLTLILGGARSGKSTYAEKLAQERGKRVAYIATGQALDEEMTARIAHHRLVRPAAWITRELPAGVGRSLISKPPMTEVILLDCLTLLVSNLMMQPSEMEAEIDAAELERRVDLEIDELIQAIHSIPADWIVVSNEVGMGLVPPYPLGRLYRDLLGRANQRIAQEAEAVILMIAGLPMRLAPLE